MTQDGGEPPDRLAERIARESYGRLLALVATRTRDIAAAEDALAEAFAAALSRWPATGPPANPLGWLVQVARNRLVDEARRGARRDRAAADLTLIEIERLDAIQPQADRRLALMYAAAHPSLDPLMRTALVLQVVLGMEAERIASACLVSPTAMAQRLVRAKRKLKDSGVSFEEPEPEHRLARLATLLDAIYAAFCEGAFGIDAVDGGGLADEALWLGRVLVAQAPQEPEAAGLLALMLFVHARRGARREAGRYIPLSDQDPRLWDAAALRAAESLLSGAARAGRPGRFQLEAALQSAQLAARVEGRTDWEAIDRLYGALERATTSPVVTLNRAVAWARAGHIAEAVTTLDRLAQTPGMATYQPYWAAAGAILATAGRADAATAFDRAIGLTVDPAVRAFLLDRRAAANPPSTQGVD
ncbi:RNA polymerase sigma factor [Brevundimonas aurifodinae]|uniref:DUF6596 domain-containing protein n=1 Tax=Brevundimonas aurifodinae TaxID=1508312 RepID=A0ABV1NMK6_9CAUL